MPLTYSTQADISFKHLSGKSHTDNIKDLSNESESISFNITSENIWLNAISLTPSLSVAQGDSVYILADLSLDPNSNGHSYNTIWPTLPPSGVDIKTGLTFSYGVGSLINRSNGDRVRNVISDSYGFNYQAKPYVSDTLIPLLDLRNWFYQYNSGIFYQDIATYSEPTNIGIYVYIGPNLSSLNSNNLTNIRVSAYGTNSYTASSIPIISTYSSNYLYLVDFANSNTTGTVSLNINSLGDINLYKYGSSGLIPLASGDIVGATGGTFGPVYYLTYNNDSFQFYKENPIQYSTSYTNPVYTQEKTGGIERGTSFDNVSIQSMWNDILYANQLSSISSFSLYGPNGTVSSIEIGGTVSPGSYTFSWVGNLSGDLESNSAIIEDISLGSTTSTWQIYSSPIISGTSNSGPILYTIGSTISSSTTGSRVYRLSLKRNNGTTISKEIDIPWLFKTYYGSSTFSSLTQSSILSLNSILSTQSYGTYTIGGSGYKYLVVPDYFDSINNIFYKGLPLAIAGSTDGYTYIVNEIEYDLLTITNSNNIGSLYKIYRTSNIISSTLSNIIVN